MSTSPFPNTPWAVAIAATPRPAAPGIYDVSIPKDWSIANLPLGGYLNSLLTNAVRTHFALHHAALAQPDPVTNHCAFISRASFGPGTIHVSVSKPGRQYSNVLARLYQPRRTRNKRSASSSSGTTTPSTNTTTTTTTTDVLVAEALITQGNLARERDSGGISLPIANPIPPSDIFPRDTGVELVDPPQLHKIMSAATKIRRVFPAGTTYDGSWAHPRHGPSVRDEWIAWRRNGGPGDGAEKGDEAGGGDGGGGGGGAGGGVGGVGEAGAGGGAAAGDSGFDSQAVAMLMDNLRPPAYNFAGIEMAKNWMATLSITTDVKKAAPAGRDGKDGWDWLFLRAVVGKCNFGRYSMDIVLLDEGGDVVAIGRRAELVLGEERRAMEGVEKARL